MAHRGPPYPSLQERPRRQADETADAAKQTAKGVPPSDQIRQPVGLGSWSGQQKGPLWRWPFSDQKHFDVGPALTRPFARRRVAADWVAAPAASLWSSCENLCERAPAVSARLLSGQQGLNRVRKEDCGTRQYGNGELKHGEHPEETDLYT